MIAIESILKNTHEGNFETDQLLHKNGKTRILKICLFLNNKI